MTLDDTNLLVYELEEKVIIEYNNYKISRKRYYRVQSFASVII